MGKLYFGILGPLQVVRHDVPLVIPPGRAQALLAVLVMHAGQVLAAERLVTELWGDAPPASAPHALQVYASRLRKLLGPASGDSPGDQIVVNRRPGYALMIQPDRCDAVRFESLFEEGSGALAAGRPAEASRLLTAACGLWRGPALGDVSAGPLIAAERIRLEELRLVAIERRIEAELALGRHGHLVAELEALVCAHPFREGLWADLIVALYRSGRPTEALHAYQRLRTMLGEELGLDPSPELRDLETAVLRHDPALAGPAVAAGRTGAPRLPARLGDDRSAPFVGRLEERAILESAWEEVEQGRTRTVFVAGEPGIGKTRLATEFALQAHDDHGALVLLGTCDEHLALPYQPFVEALRHLVAVSPETQLVEVLDERGAELARLLPELSRGVPRLARTHGTDPETERYLLFAAVGHVLSAASQQRPVVLILDDLHWATKPTVLMLRHLIRSGEPGACLIVATYRHSDIGRDHPLAELLADLRRDSQAIRVALHGLSDQEAVALMESFARRRFEGGELELVRAVQAEADGSPFFLRELLWHMVEAGLLVQTGEGWWFRKQSREPVIPDSIREVVGRRLSRLPDSTERMLTLACVLGREFDVSLLARLAGETNEAVIDALEGARRAALVSEVGGAPGRYIFAHALVRNTLYDDLGAARRVELHRRVAETLESLEDNKTRISQLAHHWVAAMSASPAHTAKAARYAEQAGRNALASLAYEEAIDHFNGALTAARQGAEGQLVCELLISLGVAQRCAGDPAHRSVLLEAGRLAQARGDAERAARAALANQRGVFSRLGAVDEERVAALQAAIKGMGAEDSAVRARLLAALATELHFAGEADRLRLSAEALAIARRVDDAPTLAQVLAARWLATWGSPAENERGAVAAELEVVSAELADRSLQFNAALAVFLTASERGEMGRADEGLTAAGGIADELGQPVLRWRMAYSRAHRALAAGRFDEAEHWATEALRLGDGAAQPDHLPLSHSSILILRLLQGRPEEVEPLVQPVLNQFPAAVVYRAALAWAQAELGDVEAARAAVRDLRGESFDDLARDYTRLLTLSQLSRATARTGDLPVADELYRQLLPSAPAMVTGQTVWLGPVTHDLAVLAGLLGRYDDADRHFDEAVATQDRIGAVGTVVHSRLEWAQLLIGQGRDRQARTLLTAARSGAEAAGLPLVESRIQRLLAQG